MITVIIIIVLALILFVVFYKKSPKDKEKKSEPSVTSDKKFVSVLPDRKLSQSGDSQKNKTIEQEKWEKLVEEGVIKDETLSELKITVDNIESSSLNNDQVAFIVFIKLDNLSSYPKRIRVIEAQYVSQNRKQKEQNVWSTGQLIEKGILKPNTSIKTGLIFDKTKLTKICKNDLLYLTIRLLDEGKEFTLHFQNKNGDWSLQDAVTKEIEL